MQRDQFHWRSFAFGCVFSLGALAVIVVILIVWFKSTVSDFGFDQ